MKRSIRIILAAAVIIIGVMDAMAIEEATYKVVKKDNKFEIRDYAPHILAETVVEGDFEEAGNKAFNVLFGYISGDPSAKGGEDQDDGSRGTAACSGKLGCKLHDAGLVHSGNPSRARGPKGHVASGSSSPDGRSALLRFLEREGLPSIQVGT
jgi:SOUL heme-binding protein